jgi:3-hydroxyisobutyrate dehydrogenase-like beta-hydroxyacid dehydrogenase
MHRFSRPSQNSGTDPSVQQQIQLSNSLENIPRRCHYLWVAMLSRDFSPSFTIDNALEDSILVAEAAEVADTWLPHVYNNTVRLQRTGVL